MNVNSNMELIQNCYAAFGRGDIPAILDMLDDDIVWINPGEGCIPTGGTMRGREGVANFFLNVSSTWNFATFEPRRFIASGDDVIALGTYTPVSLATGKSVPDCAWCMAWRVKDGRIVSFREYTDTLALAGALTTGGTAANSVAA